MISYDRPLVFDGTPWKDGIVYSGCDEDGVVVHPPLLTEVCTEDIETVWLPKAWYPSRGKAKAAVSWPGGSAEVNLDCHFTEVRCSTEWLRREDRYEDGYRIDSWTDEGGMYYQCKPEDEHAMEFWRLERKR
jgi:hypothetical protein